MTTSKFFTRSVTKNRNTQVPVYVRVSSGRGVDIVAKSDLVIKSDDWNNKTQRVRQKAEAREEGKYSFDEKLSALRKFIHDEIKAIPQSDLNSQWLKTTIDKHWHPERYRTSFFSFIESFIERAASRINPKTNQPVSYKMRREYQVTYDYLKRFAAQTGHDIDFKDVDLSFYEQFSKFLQDSSANADAKDPEERKKKLAANTIGKKIQTLKIFLNAATEEGYNLNMKFKSHKFVAIEEDADAIYLNEQELSTIAKIDFSSNPHLERVRDIFLVGCWTGLRFSDLDQVRPENISAGLIEIRQHKTGAKVVIPLLPEVTPILNKYHGKLPRIISNQKFNAALKLVAQAAGLDEMVEKTITRGGMSITTQKKKSDMVTSHTARRSFASNLYKSGFPSLSIRAITGHKSEKAFLKYIKVTPEEHARKLQEHRAIKSHLKAV